MVTPSAAVEGVGECLHFLLVLLTFQTVNLVSQASRKKRFYALLGAAGSSPPPRTWQGSRRQCSVPSLGYEGAQTSAFAPPF